MDEPAPGYFRSVRFWWRPARALSVMRCPVDVTGMRTSGRTSSRSARRTISSSMPEFAKSRSMNALYAPACGLTSLAVASL